VSVYDIFLVLFFNFVGAHFIMALLEMLPTVQFASWWVPRFRGIMTPQVGVYCIVLGVKSKSSICNFKFNILNLWASFLEGKISHL